MKDILLGLVLGYWILDKINPEKREIEEAESVPKYEKGDSKVTNLSTGLWLAGVSLGIGLLTLLIGWFMLTFISALGLIGGIGLMLTPEASRR